jgi:hypothetical protein
MWRAAAVRLVYTFLQSKSAVRIQVVALYTGGGIPFANDGVGVLFALHSIDGDFATNVEQSILAWLRKDGRLLCTVHFPDFVVAARLFWRSHLFRLSVFEHHYIGGDERYSLFTEAGPGYEGVISELWTVQEYDNHL